MRLYSVYEITCECGTDIDAPHVIDAKEQSVICSNCKRTLVIKWQAVLRKTNGGTTHAH